MHRNALWLQRLEAVKVMGEHARHLLNEGYAVDADRVLDELSERIRSWSNEGKP